jgi:RimJ/RimL family protein N-acetyltransferase
MLEGRLVRLRATEPTDRERAHWWVNDPEVTRYLTMRYPSAADDWVWPADGPPNGFGFVRLAIETKAGEHIGAVNLHRTNAEDSTAGLGIIIGAKEHWDRGYGLDAIVTLLGFAFGEMNLHRVWLTVLDEHERGIACYLTCGFREEARLRQDVYRHGRYHDFVVMGILRDEYEALHGAAYAEGGSDA